MRGFDRLTLLASGCAIACMGVSWAWADQPPSVRLLKTLPRPAPMGLQDDAPLSRIPESLERVGGTGVVPAASRLPHRTSTELVSVGIGGAPADDYSFSYVPGVSFDGRYVTFDSAASNLVRGGDIGTYDTFIRDRRTNKIEQVSVSSAGVPAEGNFFSSLSSYLSADGRFVAFDSLAGNLVPGDQPYPAGRPDVFVRDRKARTTERVSISSGGVPGDGSSYAAGLSADGRFVVFNSQARNLVPGYGSSFASYVRDRKLGVTEPVCVGSQDAPLANFNECTGCGISADGRFVAFNFFDSPNYNGSVYIRDRKTHITERVELAVGTGGLCNWSPLSLSGRYQVFQTYDLNDGTVLGLYVHDRLRRRNERVRFNATGEEPNDYYQPTQISADGRYIVLGSRATNLVTGDTNGLSDVFVVDRKKNSTRLVSVGNGGEPSNGNSSEFASISPLGRVVVFASDATNLLPEPDGNPYTDIFARILDR